MKETAHNEQRHFNLGGAAAKALPYETSKGRKIGG
jgi:hypothetical protein